MRLRSLGRLRYTPAAENCVRDAEMLRGALLVAEVDGEPLVGTVAYGHACRRAEDGAVGVHLVLSEGGQLFVTRGELDGGELVDGGLTVDVERGRATLTPQGSEPNAAGA